MVSRFFSALHLWAPWLSASIVLLFLAFLVSSLDGQNADVARFIDVGPNIESIFDGLTVLLIIASLASAFIGARVSVVSVFKRRH